MIWELWEFSRIMPKLAVADTTIWLEVSLTEIGLSTKEECLGAGRDRFQFWTS